MQKTKCRQGSRSSSCLTENGNTTKAPATGFSRHRLTKARSKLSFTTSHSHTARAGHARLKTLRKKSLRHQAKRSHVLNLLEDLSNAQITHGYDGRSHDVRRLQHASDLHSGLFMPRGRACQWRA